jgi:hypothetical protein
MMNAFYVGSMKGYEVLPEELEIFNSLGKGAYFAVHKKGKKTVIILVTEEGATEINIFGDETNGRSDPLD